MTARPTDIVCGEIGSSDAERWSAPVDLDALTHRDRAELDALAEAGVLELRAAGDAPGVQVAGTDRVGTIVLPGGRRISIRPKAAGVVLLDWLAYLGDCPPPAQWLSDGHGVAAGADFHSLLASLLLHELEKLARLPLRRDYVTARSDASTVRGRVLVGALAQSSHRLPHVPQMQRVRSPDTPHNRLLAAALDRLPALLPPDPATRGRWTALRDEWSAVSRDLPDLPRAAADARCACPPGHAAAVQLASLVLAGGMGFSEAYAGAGAASFLLSLSGVWERGLRRMCGDLAPQTGWKPVPDTERTRHWHDGPGLANPVRWMTADVLLETSAGRMWVLDAKYKRDYGLEDRNDRFQATAYAMAFGAERASLVYPTAGRAAPRWRTILRSRVAKRKHVTIDSIELPMSAGPAACRAALLDVVRDARPRDFEQLFLFDP